MSNSSLSFNTTSTVSPDSMYGIMNSYAINPVVLGIVIVVILIYVLFFSSSNTNTMSSITYATSKSGTIGNIFNKFGLGTQTASNNAITTASTSSKYSRIFMIIIGVILLIYFILKALQYFFSINVYTSITDLFTHNPKVDITVDQSNYKSSGVPVQRIKKQVFNIPGNYYGYEDAKTLCSAYGARLATYKEVEEAYNKGGEWCNYGWSDGQMALFPTQLKTYNNLQKIAGHEHDCGRPGINGGYIANPTVKFGVNCYGHKPLITKEEADLMATTPPYPITEKDIAFQHRVDYWKNKLHDILVSPFNTKLWNQIL